MFRTFINAWKIADLRKKILFTLLIIFLYRVGSVAIPVPFLDPSVMSAFMEANSGTIFGMFDLLTGGAFANATLFAMSITPYINASIIIQLLTIVIPALERMAKEGQDGRKKLNRITRYLTVALGLLQGFGYYMILRAQGAVMNDGFFTATIIVLSFTAGTALIMWLAERINDNGIGNGISIILFISIISRGPSLVGAIIEYWKLGKLNFITLPLLVIAAVAIVWFIVYISDAERRIPVQYAKKVVGRKMYGGQSTHIPIKVNMTGVLPIIFAMTFVSIPSTIGMFFPQPAPGSFWYGFLQAIGTTSPLYAVIYLLLILFFSYFYATIQFNPVEVANNLKNNGGFIPGIRPGRPTTTFISKVLNKITLFGAIFLGIVAVIPILMQNVFKMNIQMGGTTLIIIVGVALETARQLETQMMMRHYKGFLE